MPVRAPLLADPLALTTTPVVPVGKIAILGQSRNALIPPPGSSFDIDVDVSSPTELVFGIALIADVPRQMETEVGFQVVATTAGGSPRTLVEHGVRADWCARDGWYEHRVALPVAAGQKLRLTFTTRPVDATEKPADPSGLRTLWSYPRFVSASRSHQPNVVLISLDTLRMDHMSLYGYGRLTTPNLDKLAHSGVYFKNAISASSWSIPSHMSLMTSLLPSTHGLTVPPDGLRRGERPFALAREHMTLAKVLRAAGYETAAFTGGDTLSALWGFGNGFDLYDEHLGLLTPSSTSRVDAWLTSPHDRPFFLFLHTFEIHGPYNRDAFGGQLPDDPICNAPPCPGVVGLRDGNIAAYDRDIQHADEYFGRLVDRLRGLGLYQNTVIVVFSDHGEDFGDHDPTVVGEMHGNSLYDELLRVPLIVAEGDHPPFRAGRALTPSVHLIDVMPTVLGLVKIQPPTEIQGRSLVPLLEDDRDFVPVPAVSELTTISVDKRSIRTAERKYIQTTARRPPGDEVQLSDLDAPLLEELFDLKQDAGEQHNLCPSRPDDCRTARRQLIDAIRPVLLARRYRPVEVKPPGELIEGLRALGYVK
jgi:arylsulfatase A-like enzyme